MNKKHHISYHPLLLLFIALMIIFVSACAPTMDELVAKSDVEGLIKALESEDAHDREIAAQTLGDIGDARAVQPLIELLHDNDDTVIKNTTEALGKIGDSRAVQPLIIVLREIGIGENYRRWAAKALGEIGDPSAVRPLLEAQKTKYDTYFREDAAEALVKIGAPAVEPLIEALYDDEVSQYAKEALINIGAPAIEPLIQLLTDNNWKIWDFATTALINIGAPAVEPLIEALNGDDVTLRMRAAGALGGIGDERAVEALIEMLDDGDGDLQEAVALALGKIGDKRALDSLIAHFGFKVPGEYDWIVSAIRETYEPICEAFTSVVKGQGVADTAVYNPDIPGPHPLIVLDTDGVAHWWNDSLPRGWAPFSQNDVELVVVVNKEELELTGKKFYIIYIDGEEVNRFAMNGYRHTVYVEVREARTGAVLKSTTLYGSHPHFPDSYSVIPKEKSIGGSKVSFDDFLVWWSGEGEAGD